MPLPLSLSLINLANLPGGTKEALGKAAAWGYAAVQIDAAAPDVRPRVLDRSGRRDLAATLRRGGLRCSGLDLFIPPAHFQDASRRERATQAVVQALELAADLASLAGEDPAGVGVSVELPPEIPAEIATLWRDVCEERGVGLINYSWPIPQDQPWRAGIDPAALLLQGLSPDQALIKAVGNLGGVRLSDSDGSQRVALGEGRLDVRAYAAALAAAADQCWPVVDLRGLRELDHAAAAARAAWNGALPGLV